MFAGFNLKIDDNAKLFDEYHSAKRYELIGKAHLKKLKASFIEQLEAYVVDNTIDGTKIQDEWFPQIEADIFISHSHADEKLACIVAGWIYDTFGLTCFIDSNVWGYSEELLELMNSKFSDKREDGKGGHLYRHDSCIQVSAHVNMMLSIALQKMIDKVEAVILINTDNSIQVNNGKKMNSTYSPFIYAEIICTEIIRRKPRLEYRDSAQVNRGDSLNFLLEHADPNLNVSYEVQLEHLTTIYEYDLRNWRDEYKRNVSRYKYALDALYIYCIQTKEKKGGFVET